MYKYFKHLIIAIVLFSGSVSHNQTFGMDTSYNPRKEAPRTLEDASTLAKAVGNLMDKVPQIASLSGQGPKANKIVALAKMKEMHCTSSHEKYSGKSCFNTNNEAILEKIYELVVNDPDEYIEEQGGAAYYWIKTINPKDVDIKEGPLGYTSSNKETQTPLYKIKLTISGIKTNKGWDISKARIVSAYLIPDKVYDEIQKERSIKKETY